MKQTKLQKISQEKSIEFDKLTPAVRGLDLDFEVQQDNKKFVNEGLENYVATRKRFNEIDADYQLAIEKVETARKKIIDELNNAEQIAINKLEVYYSTAQSKMKKVGKSLIPVLGLPAVEHNYIKLRKQQKYDYDIDKLVKNEAFQKVTVSVDKMKVRAFQKENKDIKIDGFTALQIQKVKIVAGEK